MLNLEIENIGGIRSGTATIEDGLNVVQASNFRGKSSLIASLKTAFGATGHFKAHPLTEGADSGRVTLHTDDDTYEVLLERTGQNTVTRTGTPYLSDELDQVCTRLFGCLGEDNPIRTAVRNEDDLTEILQTPLDVEDIDRQIETLKQEKRELEAEIAEVKQAGEQLPAVQEDVTGLEQELETLREARDELAEREGNKQQIEELSDEISAKSGKLANVTSDITRLEREIERKERTLEEKQERVAEHEMPDALEESFDIDEKKTQLDTLETQIALVEDLARANQNVLETGELDLIVDVERTIATDEIECWVCGQQTTKDEIEQRVRALQSRTTELREQKQGIETELEKYEKRRRERQRKRHEREQLEEDIQRLRADLEDKKGDLQRKTDRESELETEVTELKSQLDDAEDEYNEELTDVKTEIRTKETKLEEKLEKLSRLERKYDELSALSEQRDELQSTLTELRDRKKNTQEELRDQFNTRIADIIEQFEPGFSGARLVLKTDANGDVEKITLEITRDVDGKGRRTSVDSLSEGEVELIGLVVAIAGYHAFDVDERAPIILIDGIGQLAAEHLRNLTSYLEETSDILVTTAYPEAGEFDGQTIVPDEWDVVSDEEMATI